MFKILSIDTSFAFTNISVICDGKLELLHYIHTDKKTLENMPKLLEELNIDISEFSAFAVSRGVGYLTSVRIGITFVKTWAYLYDKPVVSYENLEILARYTQSDYPKIPYLKVSSHIMYRIAGEDKISEIKIYKGEDIEGTGITLSFWQDRICKSNIVLPFFPFSAFGGMYAYEKLKDFKEGEDVFKLEPVYIK